MEAIHTDGAPAAIGPYSQAIKVGELLFCSGQIALPAGSGGSLVEGGVEAEARQSLTNLKAVLEAGGASLGSVVKTTVFLLQMEDFPAVNAIYAEFFGDHRPARACVAVSQLPKGALFEIDAVAKIG
ncbi:MAG: RidA family protein [Planctomycetes bacterium]|nr:RidA family protein [Planctomycetota bacterium]